MISNDSVTRWVIFYDGECGMCASSVKWIRVHDRVRSMFFAPLQGDTATILPLELRQPMALKTLVVAGLTANGSLVKLFIRSDAIIHICRYMGGIWSFIGTCISLIPRKMRDYLYTMITRQRHRFFVSHACHLLSESEQERFLP